MPDVAVVEVVQAVNREEKLREVEQKSGKLPKKAGLKVVLSPPSL